MNLNVPIYVAPLVLGASLAILGTLWFGLSRALQRAHWPSVRRARAVSGVMLLLVAWFFAALLPAWFGFYQSAPSRFPAIGFGIMVPLIIGYGLFRSWPLLRSVIDAVPQEWLIGVQFYRVLGAIFLVLYAGQRLPGVFAWPAGLGDLLVGLLAPVAAIRYARKPAGGVVWAGLWNLLGLADLIAAIATGFLSSPSRFQMLAFDAPNLLVSAFPLAMIPVYLVPLFMLLHLASLRKLRRSETGLQIKREVLAVG